MADLVSLNAETLGGINRRVAFETRQSEIPGIFGEMDQLCESAGLFFAGPQVALYRIDGDDMDVSVGVPMEEPLPGFSGFEAPATRALCIRHRGAFDLLHTVYPKLHSAAAEQGLQPTGLAREVYRLIARDAKWNVTDVYLDVQ